MWMLTLVWSGWRNPRTTTRVVAVPVDIRVGCFPYPCQGRCHFGKLSGFASFLPNACYMPHPLYPPWFPVPAACEETDKLWSCPPIQHSILSSATRCKTLSTCLASFSNTLKIEAKCSSETSVHFQRPRRQIAPSACASPLNVKDQVSHPYKTASKCYSVTQYFGSRECSLTL
jgi:hypothetical protein